MRVRRIRPRTQWTSQLQILSMLPQVTFEAAASSPASDGAWRRPLGHLLHQDPDDWHQPPVGQLREGALVLVRHPKKLQPELLCPCACHFRRALLCTRVGQDLGCCGVPSDSPHGRLHLRSRDLSEPLPPRSFRPPRGREASPDCGAEPKAPRRCPNITPSAKPNEPRPRG